MDYAVSTASATTLKTPCLIVGVFQGNKQDPAFVAIDQASKGHLKGILRRGDFKASVGNTQMLYEVPGVATPRILLIGLDKAADITPRLFAKANAAALNQLQLAGVTNATSVLPEKLDPYASARELALAGDIANYRFDQCKSEPDKRGKPMQKLQLLVTGKKRQAAALGFEHGHAIGQGNQLAQDLANLPGNICTPSYLADQARQLARGKRKLKVTVLEEKDMEKLGMGALLSVSRGSRQPAKLIVFEYKGGKAGSKPVALVGKGLTFDAGGISIKPAAAMDEMKYDMCGAASVFGAISACVDMDLPINVVGVVPSSENLPDGDANKPGDIVTSMSGQTIEILNTDAEGRLILCDALTYTERFDPAAVVDIATLTGACIIALGHVGSGLLSNNQKLADELLAAGESTGDRAWQLPLWDDYQSQLDSNFADMANIGGRPAGTITAAAFLSRYTRKMRWAHLDIAGTAWNSGANKGATGRPVPLLTEFLMQRAKVSKL